MNTTMNFSALPSDDSDEAEFENFAAFARAMVAVPKREIDEQEAKTGKS
jgi:CRISPR/Cas system CSM-associated protein Csm2 small subunit